MDEASMKMKQLELPVLSGFGDNAVINNEALLLSASSANHRISQYDADPVEVGPCKSNLSDISSDEESDSGFYYEKDQYLELEKNDSSSEEEDEEGVIFSDSEIDSNVLNDSSCDFSEPSYISFLSSKEKLNSITPKFELVEQFPWENDICWGQSDSDEEFFGSDRARLKVKKHTNAKAEVIHQIAFLNSSKSYYGEIEASDEELETRKKVHAIKSTEEGLDTALRCPLNQELLHGGWVDQIIWDPVQAKNMPAPPLVLDENDVHIPFGAKPTPRPTLKKLQTLENVSVKDTAPVSRRKQKRKGIDAIIKVLGGSDVSGNLEQYPTSRLGNRVALPMLDHSYLAQNHLLVRPDMSKFDLRNLHRPRKLMVVNKGVFQIVLPKKTKDQRSTSITFRGGQTINKLRKEKDISVADGNFVLLEYVEERPPILSNPGMATRLLNYYRAPADDNWASSPKTDSGTTIILQPKDPSPFLGDIQPNVMQKAVSNNLFNAPVFEHETRSTDFLLVRQPANRATKLRFNNDVYQMDGDNHNKSYMVIREIPKIFIVGQTEPQMEVYDTGNQQSKKEYKRFVDSFMEYQIGKYFDGKDEGTPVELDSVQMLFRHSNQLAADVRKRLKALADNDRNTNKWYRKPADQFPPLDELASKFRPEDVCIYESSLAGNRRINDIGIRKLTNPQKVADALQWLQKRLKIKKQRAQQAKRRARALSNTQKGGNIAKVAEVLQKQVKELDRVIEVARYIRTELLLSPWYQTSSFVNVHLQGKDSGKLRLTGVGDPSGCGEAFSFVREEKIAGKAEKANALKVSKDSDEIVKQVTGTNADLRKLSMKQSAKILQNLGLSDAEIKELKRWDRIYMIRYKCTSAVSAGGATSLDYRKFSRGGRMSHAAEMKFYRQRCNDIWARQEATLRSKKVETFLMDAEEETALEKEKREDVRTSDSENQDDSDNDLDEDDIFGDCLEEKKGESNVQDQKQLEQLRQEMQDEKEAEKEAQNNDDKQRDSLHFLKGKIPQKVVKIVKREVDQKGAEKFTIQFSCEPKLLNAVRKTMNAKIRKGLKPSALGDFQGPLATKSEAERAKEAESRCRMERGYGGRGKKKKATILNVTQIQKKIEQDKKHKRDRKLIKEREMIEEMNPHYKKRNAARNRRQGKTRMPHAKLNALFEKVLSNLMMRGDSIPFHRPVNRREVPAYYNIIKNPIDLSKIKNKIHDFEYHSREPFLDDLRLMANNARIFNGEAHSITKEGALILESAEEQLSKMEKEFSQLEVLTSDHFSMGQQAKSRKRSRAQASRESPSADSSDGSVHARPVNLTTAFRASPAMSRRASEVGDISSSSAAEEDHIEERA